MDTTIFDNIEINNTNRLCEEDATFVKQLTQKFHAILRSIYRFAEVAREQQAELPCEYVEIVNHKPNLDRYDMDKDHMRSDEEKKMLISRIVPLKVLSDAGRQMLDCCMNYENAIVAFFNRKYKCNFFSQDETSRAVFGDVFKYIKPDADNIKLPNDEFLQPPSKPVYPQSSLVLDYIFRQLGGEDFTQKALYDVSSKFNSFGIRPVFMDLAGDSIRFSSYFTFGYSAYIGPEQKEKLDAVLALISVLCGCNVTSDSVCRTIVKYIDFGTEYQSCTANANFKGLTFYKNGSLKLHFKDKETARQIFKKIEDVLDKHTPNRR